MRYGLLTSRSFAKRTRGVFLTPLFATAVILMGCSSMAQAQLEDPVMFALGARHFSSSVESLTQMAGGEEQLVDKLLAARRMEKPPFVGIRAERLLLQFGHKEQVRSALEEDMQAPGLMGLARIITINIDEVPDEGARRSLARLAVERAQRQDSFSRYAKLLQSSQDSEVSELARKALGN